MRLKPLDWVALILLIVGGINWGLVGLSSFDLVGWVFDFMPMLETTIYLLVGLSAIYILIRAIKK